MLAVGLPVFLVEHAQQTFQAVAGASGEERDLYDDAVMRQTLDERVGSRERMVIIVQIAAAHIDHRLGEVAQGMPQDVDGNDGQPIGPFLSVLVLLFDDVLLVEVLRTQVLAEAQGLRNQPGLLQLDKDKVFRTVVLANLCREVDAEERDACLLHGCILVAAHLQVYDLLFQQCGEQYLGHFLVFHQEFENSVVNRVGNDGHNAYGLMMKQMYFFFLNSKRMERLNSSIGKELRGPVHDASNNQSKCRCASRPHRHSHFDGLLV